MGSIRQNNAPNRVPDTANLGVLARIPLDMATRERADRGEPIATVDPAESNVSSAFADLAARLVELLG